MGLLAYGLVALGVLGMLGGIGYKIRESGKDAVRLEWSVANDKAKAQAEAERARQDAVREAQDKQATKRLADEKKRTAGLMVSLDAHIKASGLRADCRIPDILLLDVNTAIGGPKGVGPSAVPPKPGAATPSR